MTMQPEHDILKELEALNSPLARFPRSMPFSVPEGYFAAVPSSVLATVRLAAADEPQLLLPKAMPHTVPAGYFDSLAEAVLAKAKAGGVSYGKSSPFAVPAGYFDALPDQLLAAAKEAAEPAQRPRVIPFLPVQKAVRWAAAALLVLGLGFGSYRYLGQQAGTADVNRQLAQLDRSEVGAYLEQHLDDLDTETLANTVAASDPALKGLEKVHAEDIIQYLDETGWDENTLN